MHSSFLMFLGLVALASRLVYRPEPEPDKAPTVKPRKIPAHVTPRQWRSYSGPTHFSFDKKH